MIPVTINIHINDKSDYNVLDCVIHRNYCIIRKNFLVVIQSFDKEISLYFTGRNEGISTNFIKLFDCVYINLLSFLQTP